MTWSIVIVLFGFLFVGLLVLANECDRLRKRVSEIEWHRRLNENEWRKRVSEIEWRLSRMGGGK